MIFLTDSIEFLSNLGNLSLTSRSEAGVADDLGRTMGILFCLREENKSRFPREVRNGIDIEKNVLSIKIISALIQQNVQIFLILQNHFFEVELKKN